MFRFLKGHAAIRGGAYLPSSDQGSSAIVAAAGASILAYLFGPTFLFGSTLTGTVRRLRSRTTKAWGDDGIRD